MNPIDVTAYRLAKTVYHALGSSYLLLLDGTMIWNVRIEDKQVKVDTPNGTCSYAFNEVLTVTLPQKTRPLW